MSADVLRSLARGIGVAVLLAGLALGGGQYGAEDLLFFPLWMLFAVAGLEYWSLRRRARAAAAAGLPPPTPAASPSVRRVVLALVLASAVLFGLLAWRGQLRPEAYFVIPAAVLLALAAARELEVLARRRDAAEAASR